MQIVLKINEMIEIFQNLLNNHYIKIQHPMLLLFYAL